MLKEEITLVVESFKTLFRRKYRFNDTLKTAWYIFIPTICVCFIGEFQYSDDASNQDESTESYKSNVQKNNPNQVKKVGEVDSEFLNENNLYENYLHNYTVQIPTGFEVDYGVGAHSELRATETDSGFVLVVNVGNTGTQARRAYGTELSLDELSEKAVKGMHSLFIVDSNVTTLYEKTFEKRGLSDVTIKTISLTNFNNRDFIKFELDANSIFDNQKYPLKVVYYLTNYNDLAYHFGFRCWEEYDSGYWQERITETMGTVWVDEYITN